MTIQPAGSASLTCREAVEFIADYRAGDLDRSTRARFEKHLRACVQCERYLRSYESTVRLTKAAYAHPDAPAADEVPEALVEAILASRNSRRKRKPPGNR